MVKVNVYKSNHPLQYELDSYTLTFTMTFQCPKLLWKSIVKVNRI